MGFVEFIEGKESVDDHDKSWKNLNKKTAIRLHREMWNDIAKVENDPEFGFGYFSRCFLKETWIRYKGIDEDSIICNCFCCEYALKMSILNGHGEASRCHYCPIKWPNKDLDYACVGDETFVGVYWTKAPAEEIAKLPERH